MEKKKLKKIKKKEINRQTNQFGVILEDIDSKFDFLVEGHKALDKKIDKNYQEFKELGDEVNYKLDTHTEMIGSMKVDIEVINSNIELIKNSLKKKVDLDEFIVLEKRLSALEKRVSAKLK